MDKYNIIFANGCSFVQGSSLGGNDLPSEPVKDVPGRFSKIVADHFGADEVNLASGGAGNDKIFRTTMEWIDQNEDMLQFVNVLFCFGVTYPQRSEIFMNKPQRYVKLNIYSDDSIAERISKDVKIMTNEEVIELAKLWLVESYNEDERIKQHARLMKGMVAYIQKKAPSSDIFMFNSLGDYPDWFRKDLELDPKFYPSWTNYIQDHELQSKKTWHPQEPAHEDMANYIIEKYG